MADQYCTSIDCQMVFTEAALHSPLNLCLSLFLLAEESWRTSMLKARRELNQIRNHS